MEIHGKKVIKEIEIGNLEEIIQLNLSRIEKIAKQKNDIFLKIDNEGFDCDLGFYITNSLDKKVNKKRSFYMIYNLIKKELDIPKGFLVKVTDLWISEKTQNLLNEYDKKVILLMNPDLREEEVSNQISWNNLFSGLAVSKDLEDYKVFVREDYLIQKEID